MAKLSGVASFLKGTIYTQLHRRKMAKEICCSVVLEALKIG